MTSVKRILNPCMPVFFATCVNIEKCTIIIYNYLNEKEVVPTAINKWRPELNPYGVDDISLNDVFKILFKTTHDSVSTHGPVPSQTTRPVEKHLHSSYSGLDIPACLGQGP